MTRKLLIPVDLHEDRPAWLDFAAEMARQLDAHVVLLHVVDYVAVATPVEIPDGYPIPPIHLMTEPAEERLRTLADSLHGIETTPVVVAGMAADVIVDQAREFEVDQIVIGSHSRRGIARALLGSVAERVARTADCAVTIVPTTHHD